MAIRFRAPVPVRYLAGPSLLSDQRGRNYKMCHAAIRKLARTDRDLTLISQLHTNTN
jgi:hypothetical protein